MEPNELTAEARAFLAERRNAVLCISRPGRAPHATPVWFAFADDAFRLSITRTRVKFRLLEREPEVSLVVDDSTGYRTVIAEGAASITDGDAELLALSRTLQAKYGAGALSTETDEELLARLRREQRVVVTLRPERVLAWMGFASPGVDSSTEG